MLVAWGYVATNQNGNCMIDAIYHTDDPRDREIVERYCAMDENGKFIETAGQVADAFGVPKHELASYVREIASLSRGDVLCIKCEAPYPVANRGDMTGGPTKRRSGPGWTCRACVKAEEDEALAAREREWELMRDHLVHLMGNSLMGGRHPEDMFIRQRLLLLALMKHSGDESLSRIRPHSQQHTDSLMPSNSDDTLIELFRDGFIAIDPDSPRGSVGASKDGRHTFSPENVAWRLATFHDPVIAEHARLELQAKKEEDGNVSVTDIEAIADWIDGAALYRELDAHASSVALLEQYQVEIANLAYEIAKSEAIAYLDGLLTERDLPVRIGEKTQHVLDTALDNYSLGQVFAIIWRACRSASDYLVKTRCSKRHAANIVPGSMENFMQRALGNGWDVEPYRRSWDQPQSAYSRVLFNQVLGLPAGAMSENIPVKQLVSRQIERRLSNHVEA